MFQIKTSFNNLGIMMYSTCKYVLLFTLSKELQDHAYFYLKIDIFYCSWFVSGNSFTLHQTITANFNENVILKVDGIFQKLLSFMTKKDIFNLSSIVTTQPSLTFKVLLFKLIITWHWFLVLFFHCFFLIFDPGHVSFKKCDIFSPYVWNIGLFG